MLKEKLEKSSQTKLTYVVIVIFFIIVLLFGARDYLPKFSGADQISTEYVTAADTRKIVRDFIEENPELIVSSVVKMQQKQFEEQAKQKQEFIKGNKDKISSSNYPVLGNSTGDVTIVKFFDYRCGHCKNAHVNLEQLMSEDKGIKVVLRVVPVLGPESERAAQASIAAYLIDKDKFNKFHNALIKSQTFTNSNIRKIAKESGIDDSALLSKMDSPEVKAMLETNTKDAQSVGVQGVPGFLVEEEFIPGNPPLATFKEKINNARQKKSQ